VSGTPGAVVAFTQFADSASSGVSRQQRGGGVAVVTGHGARIASGRANVEEIVRGFDDVDRARSSQAMPLDLLIATDVLSEGLSLRRAGVIVHLDLPWTVARLEQRVGRLRRMGSPHQHISVYAIGPPVAARELLPVIRALQRKTRLVAGTIGLEEFCSALPLLGERLTRATKAIGRSDEVSAAEGVRHLLTKWANPSDDSPCGSSDAARAPSRWPRSRRFSYRHCRHRWHRIDVPPTFSVPFSRVAARPLFITPSPVVDVIMRW
jgi:hypothetical protein